MVYALIGVYYVHIVYVVPMSESIHVIMYKTYSMCLTVLYWNSKLFR